MTLARFLASSARKIPGNDRFAVRNFTLNVRRRDHFVIEDDGETIVDVISRDPAERFCAGSGQSQRNFITSLLENGPGTGDVLTGEFRPPFDQQFFGLSISPLNRGENDVARRRKGGAGGNLSYQLIAVRMDKPKFQFGDPLQLLSGRFDLGRVQSWDLDQDVISTLLGDYRFADAKFVHPFPDDLDGLLLHLGGDGTRRAPLFGNRRHQPNQKGGSTLQIESEVNFLFER